MFGRQTDRQTTNAFLAKFTPNRQEAVGKSEGEKVLSHGYDHVSHAI